ncbi:MAG: glycosyltransferase family 4 protein [Verrucomicrobiales bacterium]|nr:glycosyltransferase family 4 protein [Verrucomicrobiales bacterium]
MRVALLTHEPFHPPSGGGSAEAAYLVRELVRRGHEVHVFGPQDERPDEVAATFGIRLHRFTRWRMGRYTRLRNVKYLLYPAALARQVAAAARQTRFDVLLSQHAIAAVAAGRLRQPLQVPVVMNFLDHLTGFLETWPAWRMPPPLLAVLKRYELSLPHRFQAEAVLTVSETLADRFAAAGYPTTRLRPLGYGYDATAFPFRAEAVAARAQGPPRIVMHGSFDHHHLQRIALEAMARVRADRPDVRFEFLGSETEAWRAFLRRARRQGVADVLRHLGFVPYDAIASHLATATVGMVPYEESAGTHCAFVAKVVEYLAVGLPAVCTPLDSLRRYFHDEPLLRFSRFDGASFGDTLLAWLREPWANRAALAGPAARRVRERLDWPVICRRAADVVEWAGRPGSTPGDLPP